MDLDAVRMRVAPALIDQPTSMLRQLAFFEKTHIVAKWPDSSSLEGVMIGMFERLKAVRDLNKK